MSYHIPIQDLADFGRLKDDCKAEVQELADAMDAVDHAPKIKAALIAQGMKLKRSYSRMRDLYYGVHCRARGGSVFFRDGWKTAGWRALIDRAKYQPVAQELPASFVDFWLQERAQHQRDQTGKAAHDTLKARLHAWERDPHNAELRVPGYDLPPARDAFTNLPRGWSYGNLLNYRATGLENAALRRGRGAALDYRVSIITTRVGLKVGQFVQFDDQWYDNWVNFLGVNRKLQRVLGLDAVDVASADCPAHAFLPMTVDAETGSRVQLKAYHAEWFAAHVLMTFGYRADTGSTHIIEHGTMTVNERYLERAERATGGKVKYSTSGIIDNKAHAGMFDGKGGGNFKFKALLEGSRVAHRNRASALPAPTGLDPDHAPEESYHGLQRVNNRVLKLMEKLPPERAALLAHHATEFHTFVSLALEIYELLATNPDHECEGWIGNGWVVTEWRHALESADWHTMEELEGIAEPMMREGMKALLASKPGLLQTRRLSRRDVRLRHQGELATVRGAAVSMLLGPDGALISRVGMQEPLFTIQDAELFPEPIHFLARLKETRQVLERGREYKLYVDPFGGRRAEVHDLDGRWLGGVQLWDRPSLADTEALGERFGIAQAVFDAELKSNVPRWAMPTTQARTAIFERNAAVAKGEAITPEEKAEVKRERAAVQFGAAVREEPAQEVTVRDVAAVETWDATIFPEPQTPSETW